MGSVVRYRRGTGSMRVKTGADVVAWLGTDAPFSFPGFTSSFDNSTVGPVEPDHHRDQSRNERQTNNQKQSGRHDVWLLFCASSFAFRRSLMAFWCFDAFSRAVRHSLIALRCLRVWSVSGNSSVWCHISANVWTNLGSCLCPSSTALPSDLRLRCPLIACPMSIQAATTATKITAPQKSVEIGK